jgi:HK97 gp10 family phage protein
MSVIQATLKGLLAVQRDMERIARELHGDPMITAVRKSALLVVRDAKLKAPVDTGRLRASITPVVRLAGLSVVGVVGASVKYAGYVELGTRPHFVSAANIGRWAKRHGHGYTGLMVSGKAQPYLYPAFQENADKIAGILEDAVTKIVSA